MRTGDPSVQANGEGSGASVPPQQPGARRGAQGRALKQRLVPYAFLTPNMILFGLFSIFPAFYSFYLSLFSTSPLRPSRFVGLGNYGTLAADELFRRVVGNTVLYVVLFTTIVTCASVAVAVLLNQRLRARGVFRAAFFLPVLLSPAVVGLVWRWILDREVGLLNIILEAIRLPPQPWLLDSTWAMVAIIGVGVWIHAGFFALIVLAGLQGINQEVLEAAAVDGASSWHTFRFVTLPLLRPTVLVVLILSVIAGFKAFDYIFVLTGGGPVFSTALMVHYIYRAGFEQFQFGLGAAASIVLFFVVFTLTVGQYVYGRRREAI